jgi:dihydrofolate reductase
MRISIVVATDLDGVIGRDNGLPWHLPADLRHFKRLTMGKPMIMGRRTWDSIGRALPGRASIVLTRRAGFAAPGCVVARGTEEALARAAEAAADLATDEVVVIGGAQVFREFLPRADRVYWTQVQAHVGGETRIPRFDPLTWLEIDRTDLPAGADNEFPLRFLTLERRHPRRGARSG